LKTSAETLPEPPQDSLRFRSRNATPDGDRSSLSPEQMQDNLVKILPAVNEYLDRAAPLPDLDTAQTKLREDMPPTLAPDSPMSELVSDLLQLVEDTYRGL